MIDKEDYSYNLPDFLIAQYPSVPRDRSRLFVYDAKNDTVMLDYFDNLDVYLSPQSFLVLNETKVLPSRVLMRKLTGGKVNVLFLVNEQDYLNKNHIRIMPDRKVKAGERLFFRTREYVEIINQKKQLFLARYSFSRSRLEELLIQEGSMPIPLYIKKSPLTEQELRKKYQTVFARQSGSSAAPTASLHFTRRLLDKLEKQGIQKAFITLHVGLGTFAPVSSEQMRKKRLHKEWFEAGYNVTSAIAAYKRRHSHLVAVGTTVVRTLESVALQTGWENRQIVGKTDLFIYPPYRFRLVDHLITNFHLPGSSLMMLVEAFLQYKGAKRRLTDLYDIAVREKFRFYSFGDAMLIL